jgi:hypothetical protein
MCLAAHGKLNQLCNEHKKALLLLQMEQIQTITLLLMLWLVTVETVPSLGSVLFVHYTVMHEVTRSAIV